MVENAQKIDEPDHSQANRPEATAGTLQDAGSTVRGMREYSGSDLSTEVLPLIPIDGKLGPGTSVSEAMKTKTPGRFDRYEWWGLRGAWKDELFPSKKDLKE